VRLDRYLSRSTGLTRRQAQQAIRAGEVRVRGAMLKDPGAHITPGEPVEFNAAAVTAPAPRYFMLNKPPGVVCATHDREHRTVLDLLDLPNTSGLHIAGRLDRDATGLVFITDDGDWSHRVTSPRHQIAKSYRVSLAEPLTAAAAAMLESGVQLEGEERRCAPAQLERISETDVRLIVTEGKYHQVKRMFAAAGNHVLTLHRERIGALTLDPALPPGASRPLTQEETASFLL
jgi:16S rRNA pseudouridine516 synthase